MGFQSPPRTAITPGNGEAAEWSIAAVLKTVEVRASVGSNPTLSATQVKCLILKEYSDMLPPDALSKADNNGVTEDMQYIIHT